MNNLIYKFLEELSKHHLYFTVNSQEADSIIIGVDVPGQHWKIEFWVSGIVKVDIFRNVEGVLGEEKLTELLKILNINSDSILKSQNGMEKLFAMINKLHRGKKIFFMAMHREDEYPIMVKLEVPNEYWEIEFFESGEVEIEVFKSDGRIYGEEVLSELIKVFAD